MKTFREAVQSEAFTVTAELTLSRNSTADDIRRQADVLAPYVDAIQVTDNPYAWVQMSALSASSLLLAHGVDPVPILTCRDRNRIALESDLLGLRTLGVSSLILTRGHRVPKQHAVKAANVFDMTSRELIALASVVGEGDEAAPGPGFFIGTGARAFRPNAGWRAESLTERAAAGARFVQTQICFNLDILRHWMRAMVEAKLTWRYSVIVSLAVLPSAVTARWVKENLSDSRIPNSMIQRLEEVSDPEQEGVRICAETMQQISEIPGVSGVHLMTTGDAVAIPAAVQASGLRQ